MEIKCYSVSYCYHEKKISEYRALDNVTLNIKPGRINGVIGENGSGKTTLVELFNLLRLPTKGVIQIGNYILEAKKVVEEAPPQFDIGFVFASAKEQFFLPTVKKEIAFGMKQFSYRLSHIEKRISDALKMVGLDDTYLNRNPLELSNGEMKKVSIASVLAFNPEVIVLDEPTIGLDDISKESFLKMLKILKNRYHKTIIVVTQDSNLIHRIADYIFVFHNGALVLEGTKYEVFLNDEIEKFGLVRPDMIEFSFRVLKQKGIKLGYRDDINDLIKDIYRHSS